MHLLHSRLNKLIITIVAVSGMLATSVAFAVSRCGTFDTVPVPGMTSHLAALDAGTLWAIGASAADSGVPVLRHFDGTTWSEQALPPEADGFVFGASGSTPDGDAWFSATRAFSVYEIEVLFMRIRGAGVDRIDILRHPSGPIDISGSSTTNVWALTAGGDAFHFDGSAWQEIDLPPIYAPDQRLYPKAIYTTGPDDVWTVGYGGSGRATYIGYTQHWDGTTWSKVATPFDGQDPSFFRDIDGSGPDDIWVAGDAGYLGDILLHWDGNEWSRVPGPASGTAMARVMTMGPGNAWALPYSLAEGDLFYYWNGMEWSEGARLDLPDAVTINWHDTAKVGECDAWAVGAYYDGSAYRPLAARLMPGTEPPPVNESPLAVAAIIGPVSGPAPFNPVFSSAGSSDPDGSITAWHWDFGDGTFSTLPNPSNKLYSTPGIYNLRLTVTDNEGATGSDESLTVTVTDPQCTLNCLQVNDISFSIRQRRGSYEVTGSLSIRDEQGRSVSGVSANATWTLPDGSSVNQMVTSNRRGVARFKVKSGAGIYRLDLTNLRLAGYTFDPDNSQLSGTASVP
ncbi:MAG: PKD domain-containing protein [Chromatiaceae bacterium]|nr:PKD domain-containing protein [Chromatiaceae bacterium]